MAYCMARDGDAHAAAALLERAGVDSPAVVLDRARLLLHADMAEEAVAVLEPLMVDTQKVEVAAVARLLGARALNDNGASTNAMQVLAGLRAEGANLPPDFAALAMASEAFLRSQGAIADAQAVTLAESAVKTAESLLVKLECDMTCARISASMVLRIERVKAPGGLYPQFRVRISWRRRCGTWLTTSSRQACTRKRLPRTLFSFHLSPAILLRRLCFGGVAKLSWGSGATLRLPPRF